MVHLVIFVEKMQAFLAVHLREQIPQSVAAAKEAVEMFVAETNAGIVGDAAAVIHPADVGPKNGAEAHVAGLAGGVKRAPCKVVGAQCFAGLSYGHNLAVGGGVVVLQHAVVGFGQHHAVLHDDTAERAAVPLPDAFASLRDGHLHIFVVFFHRQSSFTAGQP